MNASDWIQLLLAVTAAIGAIFAFWNIRVSNKAIELQKKQWEHSAVPVYRISYITYAQKGVMFVFENTNNVAHQVEDISFSMDEVKVEFSFNGTVEKSETKHGEKTVKEEHRGLVVKLVNTSTEYICGRIQLRGKDSLGNKFCLNSNSIELNANKLKNDLILSRTYLNKV
ncbi:MULTISPECIES: hypothetical protein [unclassified Sporosarcina]|uniref:hypothetical protein n=1 Tax=unclassified Sporosarcina TaxID=2647733 RepID=UPI000C16D1EE|nr:MULTISPECIES: hypothetical protein [unclassified Sporosarcina]PIC69886.1 hypothetical protein CSV77_11500 [Sporosarcina sp. P16b]PID25170.1 hypothetical protein CSV60_05950 [Sporosarcina sp. P7]